MIPNFPVGATIGAIHAACVHAGRFVSVQRSIPGIYGIRTDPSNRFGLLADAFAKNALDGSVTGSDLIEKNSALPLFASLLASESRTLWKDAQLAGDANAWLRYFPPGAHGDLFAPTPRMCPQCVSEDISRYGVPYWRVHHQVSWVESCQAHEQTLHDRCGECGSPFPHGLKIRIPGAICPKCSSARTSPIEDATPSTGRAALEELLARACSSTAPELGPEVRIQLLREAFAGQDASAVEKRFMAFWKARGVFALQRVLRCSIPAKGLTRMIATGSGQLPVSVLFSLVTFAARELGEQGMARAAGMAQEQEVRLQRLDAASRHSATLADALAANARALSMPREVVEMLLRGDMAAAYLLVGGLNLVALVDRLPVQHRSAFASAFRTMR